MIKGPVQSRVHWTHMGNFLRELVSLEKETSSQILTVLGWTFVYHGLGIVN